MLAPASLTAAMRGVKAPLGNRHRFPSSLPVRSRLPTRADELLSDKFLAIRLGLAEFRSGPEYLAIGMQSFNRDPPPVDARRLRRPQSPPLTFSTTSAKVKFQGIPVAR